MTDVSLVCQITSLSVENTFTCNSQSHECHSWLRVTVVERRSFAGKLSLSCARLAADG